MIIIHFNLSSCLIHSFNKKYNIYLFEKTIVRCLNNYANTNMSTELWHFWPSIVHLFNSTVINYQATSFPKKKQTLKYVRVFFSPLKVAILFTSVTPSLTTLFFSVLYAHIGKMLLLGDISALDFRSWREYKYKRHFWSARCFPCVWFPSFYTNLTTSFPSRLVTEIKNNSDEPHPLYT